VNQTPSLLRDSAAAQTGRHLSSNRFLILQKQCVGAGLDVYIRHLGVLELRFRSYSEEPFTNAGMPDH
jgi:hypothetical protein